MRKFLAILVVGLLAGAGAASALTLVDAGSAIPPDSMPSSAARASSPEPLTILALATGAAVAGGLSRRRRR